MKKNSKRIVSLLLALTLCLGFGMSSMAASSSYPVNGPVSLNPDDISTGVCKVPVITDYDRNTGKLTITTVELPIFYLPTTDGTVKIPVQPSDKAMFDYYQHLMSQIRK